MLIVAGKTHGIRAIPDTSVAGAALSVDAALQGLAVQNVAVNKKPGVPGETPQSTHQKLYLSA